MVGRTTRLLLACLFAWPLSAFASSQGDAIRGNLAGSYFSEDNSKLVLEPGGAFGWVLTSGDQRHYMKGRWERVADEVHLSVNAPGEGREPFVLVGERSWGDDDARKLLRSEELHATLTAYETCPFLKSYYEGGSRLMIGLPLAKADMAGSGREKSAAVSGGEQQTAQLRHAHRHAEQAVSAALHRIATGNGHAGDTSGQSPTENPEMDAAETAVREYWRSYEEVAISRLEASGSVEELPLLAFDPAPCFDMDKVRAAASAEQGFAVAIRETMPGNHAWSPRMVVEFVFADGGSEPRLSDDGGWAGIAASADKKLERIGLHPVDAAYPVKTLAVDAARAVVFDVRLDSSAVVEPPYKRVTFSVDRGDLVSQDWRYSCLSGCTGAGNEAGDP